MKGVRAAALTLLALAIAAWVALVARIGDGESVRAAIGSALEATLGEPVSLGGIETAIFPLPALRIRDLRIGTRAGIRVEAPELRVGVSPWGLLLGRVVLRSIELESPELFWPHPGGEAHDPRAERPARSRWKQAGALPPSVQLAIARLVVKDGRLSVGPLRVERISLSGAVGAAGAVGFDFSALSPGLGEIGAGRLSLSDVSGPIATWPWSVNAQLDALDLAELRRRFDIPGLFGNAAGTLAAVGRGAASERVSLALESSDLDLRGALVRATGRTKLAIEIPGRVEADLTGAVVRFADSLEKPVGSRLRVSAELSDLRALHFERLYVEAEGGSAQGHADLAGETPSLELSAGSLDLAALSSWSGPTWLPRAGRVELEHARIAGAPLSVRAAGALADVPVALTPQVSVNVSGHVSTDGVSVRGDDLQVKLAGEEISASGLYDWHRGQTRVVLSAKGPRFGPLAEALWGRNDVSGRLYGHVELAGPTDHLALSGEGELELKDGEIANVSLERSAGMPRSFDDPPGLDRFDSLSASFELAGDEMNVLSLSLVQDYAMASLSGRIYLRDWSADMTGAARFEYPGLEPAVREIPRAGGPIYALETDISNATSDDDKKMEAAMIKKIRKVEAKRRDAKANGPQ